eukprot:4563753-Alexandrium_andersonii.AAC.1
MRGACRTVVSPEPVHSKAIRRAARSTRAALLVVVALRSSHVHDQSTLRARRQATRVSGHVVFIVCRPRAIVHLQASRSQ